MKQLRKLELYNCEIKTVKFVRTKELVSLTDLRHLNLSYNSLTIDLLQFCSEHFFSESLENLILVKVEEEEEDVGVVNASS